MTRWLALMDEFGNELSYENYHREKVPPTDDDQGWASVWFNLYRGTEVILVAGGWICDSETSRMRDGTWVPFTALLNPREILQVSFRTRGGMDAAQQFI